MAKREADGREGAVSGRLARKATGVSPFCFARTCVFAGKEIRSISLDSIDSEPEEPPVQAILRALEAEEFVEDGEGPIV